MKNLTVFFLALLTTSLVYGQAPVKDPLAEAVLQRVAKKYKAYKSYKVNFTRKTDDANGKPIEVEKGILSVEKDRFRIESGDVKLYCDGKTLYTYVISSKEVNITDYEPNPDEINPRDVFTLYKTGYKYMFSAEVKTPTGMVQIIDLEPEDITRDIAKVRLIVDKKTATLRKYIITERGTNNKSTFSISTFTPNPAFPVNYFAFNKVKNPKVKVVDLR